MTKFGYKFGPKWPNITIYQNMLQFTMVYEIYRNMKYLSTIKGQELQTNLKIKNSKQSLPQRQILMELELEFEELEFLNSGRSLYISETLV